MKREEFEQMYAAEDRLWWYLGLRENALALLGLDRGAGAGARPADRVTGVSPGKCGSGRSRLPDLPRRGELAADQSR